MGDQHVNYAGMILRVPVSETLTLSSVNGYENIDIGTQDIQRWTYRLNLDAMLSPTVGLQVFYQYVDSSGTFDFSEHALYVGATKRF